MKQTIETMRYKVPKVKNRFLQTHLKLIVICAVVAAVLIMLAFSYVIIYQSYVLRPKATILLFCEVANLDEAQSQLSKYDDLFNGYLVRYEADFNDEGAYDLSEFGSSIAEKYATPNATLLAVMITPSGITTKEFTFKDAELSTGATLDTAMLDELIALIRSSL